VASSLRDQRDARLRDLSEIMDIQTREQPGGAVNVYVGSEPIVEYNRSRGLSVERELRDGLEIWSVRFADNNGPVNLRDGALAGLVTARDRHLRGQLDKLDQLASGLIYEVNRIHGSGVGLAGYESMRSQFAVGDTAAALNSGAAGLQFPVQNGTFIVNVRDKQTGQVVTRQIEVDLDGLNGDDTSLASLAAQLDGVPGLNASVAADNRLELAASSGQEFWFSQDSSGVPAALGLGSFFKGSSAADIGVADNIAADPRRLAASATGAAADGDIAGRIAELASPAAVSGLLSNRSVRDFHASMVGELGVEGGAALTAAETADAVYSGLYAQREALSGVSLDEEALNLTKFEKAYQGAARYLTVLNEMTDEILRLV
jgi:flagellar hook-associated protein 1